MSGLLDKMSNFFFKDVDQEGDMVNEEAGSNIKPPLSTIERPTWNEEKKKAKPNLVTVPGKGSGKGQDFMEMVLIKAASYEDMQEIANHIKARKVVVANFEDMDREVAQKMVDFLSGATFALDGVPRKVSGGTFIFSSSNVDLSGQIMEKDGSFNDFNNDERFSSTQWLKNK